MQNEFSDILIVNHKDFKLLIDCSKFNQIRTNALSNLGDATKMQVPYLWTEDVKSIFVCGKELTVKENKTDAIFFENVVYPVWFDFGVEEPEYVELDTSIERFKGDFQQRKSIFYGFVNYGNEIGKSNISIRYKLKGGSERKFKLEYYVLSTKLDYFSDWNIIVRDIEREYQMLSLSFLQRTYHNFNHSPQGETPDIIWWNLFNEYHHRFISAVKWIIERPYRRLRAKTNYARADKLKRVTPDLERELECFRFTPTHLYRTKEELYTQDTPENRFLKYTVLKIKERFQELKKRIFQLPDFSDVYREELNDVERQLKQLSLHPFFRKISSFRGLYQESLILQRAVGYRDVYQIWLILRSSYSLQDGMHELQTKDIATLYEIWCFITVKNMVEDYLRQQVKQLNVNNLSRIELNRLFSYNLSKGDNSRIIFKENDVELAELIYNPQSEDEYKYSINQIDSWDRQVVSKTVTQRPDIVLRLSKIDYQDGIKLTYLFDAKYRIDKSEKVSLNNNSSIKKVDCPPEDAINQMHRYRDAILFSTQKESNEILQKEIIGGYILFPGRGENEAFEQSKFTKSQNSVNIGAFPLRPNDANSKNGSEVLLRKFINNILSGEALQILKRSIPQKGLEYKTADNEHVFVGVVTDKLQEYSNFLINKASLYYTGKSFPSTYNVLLFKYFAPYFRREGIKGYYDITGIRSATKSEILQNGDTDESMRFFFQLGEYHELKRSLRNIQLYKDTYADILFQNFNL